MTAAHRLPSLALTLLIGAAATPCGGCKAEGAEAAPAASTPDRGVAASVEGTEAVPRKEAPSGPHRFSRENVPVPLPKILDGATNGTHGVVTSVNDEATRVGVRVLEEGGNAVDAAVATGFALAVVHQSAASLGGGGFLLLVDHERVSSFDFREQSPESLTEARFQEALGRGGEPLSVGVPGTVSGLLLAHERYGKLSRAQVLEGAIRLASEGYSLSPHQARALSGARATLSTSTVARALFLRNGRVPASGTRLKNVALGRLLRRIASEGPSAFYGEDVGEELSRTTERAIRPRDLSKYSALERRPLALAVGEYRVFTMAPPSGGGLVLLEALRLLGPIAPDRGALVGDDFHRIAEALRRGHVDRRLVVADPARMDRSLVETDFAPLLGPERHSRHPIIERRRTPSHELDERFGAALAELEHTTHFSVVDSEGNAVSCTVTLSSSLGSKLVTPSGFVLNNSVLSFATVGENRPRPQVRTVSSMTPTLVVHPSGLVLVLGSPGGDTIPGTVLQTLVRLLRGTTLVDAVRAPRIHQAFVPDRLFVERGFPAAIGGELRSFGHTVELRGPIGDANVAAFDGKRSGAIADPREGGLALAAKPRN